MPEFNFNLEWSDGYLYLTEEDGSGCRWECKTPEKAGEYVAKYIEAIIIETEYEAEQAAAAGLLETIESYYENREY
jgi:hypothetical protein